MLWSFLRLGLSPKCSLKIFFRQQPCMSLLKRHWNTFQLFWLNRALTFNIFTLFLFLTFLLNWQVTFFVKVTFNPQDNTQLCVVGNGIFKLFRYSEGNLKQFAFQKMEPQNFLCQAWVSDERIIAGTDSGRLLLFESGELKNELHVSSAPANASAPTRLVLKLYTRQLHSIDCEQQGW